MGRIKSKLVKRTSRQLIEGTEDSFGKTFKENKKALQGTPTSKRIRNKIAGYITRIKKNKKTLLENEQ
jgi:small subunit ribosomal protein S17e